MLYENRNKESTGAEGLCIRHGSPALYRCAISAFLLRKSFIMYVKASHLGKEESKDNISERRRAIRVLKA